MIVEYIIHGVMRNYTKLACNRVKMIPNDTVSQPIRQGMISLTCVRIFVRASLRIFASPMLADRLNYLQ